MSPQMFSEYGELRSTNGWDPFGSLGHPSRFQRVSRLGSVTARHSSSRRQPNFAALNRGRHLYSAERPSRWALAHVLVFMTMLSQTSLVDFDLYASFNSFFLLICFFTLLCIALYCIVLPEWRINLIIYRTKLANDYCNIFLTFVIWILFVNFK